MIELLVYLLNFLSYLVGLYAWVVIAAVILSWLTAFGVINPHNGFVRSLASTFYAVTEPLLKPIRAILPNLGAIDISPVILLIGCYFVQGFIQQVVIPNLAKAL